MSLDQGAVDAIAELGRRTAADTTIPIGTGGYLDNTVIARLRRDNEVLELRDLERLLPAPRQARGTAALHDPVSFAAYVTRMHAPEGQGTTLWADDWGRRVVAVFNDHTNDATPAWRDHTASLTVRVDPDWTAWVNSSGHLLTQVEFGEFLQDQAHVVVDPPAAELYMIATTLTAKRNVTFESSVRQQSGDVAFEYREETAATTGKGKVEVPERFSVRMSPFLGAEQVQITARLRYRIDAGSGLRIGYTLQRPDIAEREAFEAILAGIDGGLPEGVPILLGTAPEALR